MIFLIKKIYEFIHLLKLKNDFNIIGVILFSIIYIK